MPSPGLSLNDPVSEIQGIGRKRAAILGAHDIYSLADFLDRTERPDGQVQVASIIGLRVDEVRELRMATLRQLGPKKGSPRRKIFRYCLGAFLLLLGATLIVGGLAIVSSSFYAPHYAPCHIKILMPKTSTHRPFDWKVSISTRLERVDSLKSIVTIHNDADASFGHVSPLAIPHGILLTQIAHGKVRNASAEVTIFEEREERQGVWVSRPLEPRQSLPVAVTIKELPPIENLPGGNVMLALDRSPLMSLPAPDGARLTIRIEVTHKAKAAFLDNWRPGLISQHVSVSASEQTYGGLGKRKFGGVTLPGVFLEVDQPRKNAVWLEYRWKSDVKGRFESAERMKGRAIYEESRNGQISLDFVFRAEGAQWVLYLASVIGWPVAAGGLAVLKGWIFRDRRLRQPDTVECRGS